MSETKFDGTIRAVNKNEKRKKDVDKRTASITVMNEEGDKAVFTFVDSRNVIGYNPEDQVVVSIGRANRTLQECTAPDEGAPEEDELAPEEEKRPSRKPVTQRKKKK